MTPQERRQRLKELYEEIHTLKLGCVHSIPEQPKKNSFAICEGCGECFGWYCPSSPDHICHYHSHEGMVVDVRNDQEIPVPEGHDPQYEGCGICIFCGEPDERK